MATLFNTVTKGQLITLRNAVGLWTALFNIATKVRDLNKIPKASFGAILLNTGIEVNINK